MPEWPSRQRYHLFGYARIPVCGELLFRLLWATGVHGEFIVKPLREVGSALDSEFANEGYSTWFAVWEYLQKIQPGYRH